MENESRVKKTLLNGRINLIFYLLVLVITFWSRKIFLDHLGADFIGLTGTLQNILGFLNLAEFGISSAVSFNLFKPIRFGEKNKIVELVSLFGYYYSRVGAFIAVGGVLFSCFIPLIFREESISLGVVYFAFYSFLTSSLIGYFINYRQILLSADQKNYVVSIYFQTGNILKTLLQLYLAYKWANYYIWISIELSFGIIYAFILNKKIDQVYPWLKCSIKKGAKAHKLYPNILKSTKQVFIHKFKDFFLGQSDQILVFAFVSLKMVAYYGNYVLLINRLSSVFTSLFAGSISAIGNLVAEGNKQKTLRIFWELMALRYFIAGFVVYNIYVLVNPFVFFWLGEEYILSNSIIALLLATSFISLNRGTVDEFNHAYGHYGDVWAAWVEGFVNVTVTIIAASKWGIIGILLGKLSSLVPIVVFWKPFYLFKDGFGINYSNYWKGTIRYYIAFVIAAFISYFSISHFAQINPYESFIIWILFSVINVCVFTTIYLTCLLAFTPGTKNLLQRLPILRKILH